MLKTLSSLTSIRFCRLFAGVFLVPLLSACNNSGDEFSTEAAISLTNELGGSPEGYERACEPRDFVFPGDHGAHPAYRNEWWYVTGNLNNVDGRKFGFHATFFRIANQPVMGQSNIATSGDTWVSDSAWAAHQFYMGHFAISEEGSAKTVAHERFARAAAGLAGATSNPVRVWLDDWQLLGPSQTESWLHRESVFSNQAPNNNNLASAEPSETTKSNKERAQWQLDMSSGDESVALTLNAIKPPVLQGNDGLSYKSDGDCNASYYYSISRLNVNGSIINAGATHEVTGTAWIDREWSSSVLADNQVGWDWFALQLNDGRDLMIYQLRQANGQTDTHSYAVEIDSAGNKKLIPNEQIDVVADRWWKSPTGASYPVSGRIYRADTDETILYQPLIDNQELPLTVRYWEGAILLSDETNEPIGHGYLELTGY